MLYCWALMQLEQLRGAWDGKGALHRYRGCLTGTGALRPGVSSPSCVSMSRHLSDHQQSHPRMMANCKQLRSSAPKTADLHFEGCWQLQRLCLTAKHINMCAAICTCL